MNDTSSSNAKNLRAQILSFLAGAALTVAIFAPLRMEQLQQNKIETAMFIQLKVISARLDQLVAREPYPAGAARTTAPIVTPTRLDRNSALCKKLQEEHPNQNNLGCP